MNDLVPSSIVYSIYGTLSNSAIVIIKPPTITLMGR